MWCGDYTLKKAFLKLYCISRNKEFSIAEVMHFPNQMLHWDILFSRAIQDWELEPLSVFMDLIYSMPLKGEDMTNFVGSQERVRVLRCVNTISPFPRLLAFLFHGSLCGVQIFLVG